MEKDNLRRIICNSVMRVCGPRGTPSEVAAIDYSVEKALEEEAPFTMPDDIERVAASVCTNLRLNGITRQGDVVLVPLCDVLSAHLDFYIPDDTIGIGFDRVNTELLMTIVQSRILELDAWALERDGYQKTLDEHERRLLVRLKENVAEANRRYRPKNNFEKSSD